MLEKIRALAKSAVINSRKLNRPAINYCTHNLLLPSIITETPSWQARELLFLPKGRNYTQSNQDLFALLVNRFASGFFLEIGANDGETYSNTLYLEEHFGWSGLLIEANPVYQTKLGMRRAETAICAITQTEGDFEFVDAGLYGGVRSTLDTKHSEKTVDAKIIKVRGAPLNIVLKERKCPNTIDFVSIDVEGGELPIVRQLCELEGIRVRCGCIEHNGRASDYQQISDVLTRAGYKIVWLSMTGQDLFFMDGTALRDLA